jgi:hypothetical protein
VPSHINIHPQSSPYDSFLPLLSFHYHVPSPPGSSTSKYYLFLYIHTHFPPYHSHSTLIFFIICLFLFPDKCQTLITYTSLLLCLSLYSPLCHFITSVTIHNSHFTCLPNTYTHQTQTQTRPHFFLADYSTCSHQQMLTEYAPTLRTNYSLLCLHKMHHKK